MPVAVGVGVENWSCSGIWCVGGGLSVWGKKYGALLGAGFVYGEKMCVCAGGEGFLCTNKGYYIPLIYWAEVPGSGGKRPHIIYPPSRIPKTKKIELYPSLELYRDGSHSYIPGKNYIRVHYLEL